MVLNMAMSSEAKLGLYMICQIHIKSPSLVKLLLSLSLFSMILAASSGSYSSIALHNAKAQQPAASSNSGSNPSFNETNPNTFTITANNADEVISESYNTISNGSKGNLSTVLLNQIVKPIVLEDNVVVQQQKPDELISKLERLSVLEEKVMISDKEFEAVKTSLLSEI
jgi:hypothetical protein